ncbi:MAG: hypothetical protein R6V85_10370, partial [Polyangia bacterium]
MLPMVMVWYGTAINFPEDIGFDDSDPKRRPTSWAGWSYDGERFYAAYTNGAGEAVPFSVDDAPDSCPNSPGTTCSDPGIPA